MLNVIVWLLQAIAIVILATCLVTTIIIGVLIALYFIISIFSGITKDDSEE